MNLEENIQVYNKLNGILKRFPKGTNTEIQLRISEVGTFEKRAQVW
jgi:hypothetical protein